MLLTITQNHDVVGLGQKPGKCSPSELTNRLLEASGAAVLISREKCDVLSIEARTSVSS